IHCENLPVLPLKQKNLKVDDFYAAREDTIPSLQWTNIAPPFTSSGADFGGDVVFSFLGHKFVGQCKNLNKSVGVKAVQEINSAISYYQASHGVVFSKMGFTEPAIILAETNGVLLVTGTDMVSLTRQIAVVLA
ncbi:MAG: restriction endonuclease, partial [Robiginitomaculum sp.]|nr:restriction endonuclease [Robiginitomaculum sp.]